MSTPRLPVYFRETSLRIGTLPVPEWVLASSARTVEAYAGPRRLPATPTSLAMKRTETERIRFDVVHWALAPHGYRRHPLSLEVVPKPRVEIRLFVSSLREALKAQDFEQRSYRPIDAASAIGAGLAWLGLRMANGRRSES